MIPSWSGTPPRAVTEPGEEGTGGDVTSASAGAGCNFPAGGPDIHGKLSVCDSIQSKDRDGALGAADPESS